MNAPSSPPPKQVRRRHVIYLQGYDPRGLAEYYRMFRAEFRKFLALYGLRGEVGKPHSDEPRHTTQWSIETESAGWRVETTYEFLRWDDIIRQDFVRPWPHKIASGLRWFFYILRHGVFARFFRAHWRFALFTLYPYAILLLNTVVSALIGWLAAELASLLPAPRVIAIILGIAAAILAFVLQVRFTEPRTFLLYMLDDITSHAQFASGLRPDWESRFQSFAEEVVRTVQASDADEVVIVGHSSGSFIAVDVLVRALAIDPALGRRGPRISLFTVGANLPAIGFLPKAGWFIEKLRRLGVEPSIDWVDFQSRKDAMNFYPFDPMTGHGIELGAERRNPAVVAVRFRDMIKPENYKRFRRRFFQVHFQFLKANERKGAAYDYFMICCGPFLLKDRATRPHEVVAASEKP